LLDPIVGNYAGLMGLPTADTSSDITGMGLGTGVSLVNNVLFGGLAAKVIAFLEGIGAQYAAGHYVPGERNKADLAKMGTYLTWELLDPKPEDLVAMANAIAEIRAGIQFGDWSRVGRVFGVKTPLQISSELKSVSQAFSRAFALPAAAPPAPPPAPPEAPRVEAPTGVVPTARGIRIEL